LNGNECIEEGEIFEYQEEDRGQDEKGKPSKLVAYLILVLLLHVLKMFMKMHVLYCYYL
jgi:hypothetical protein